MRGRSLLLSLVAVVVVPFQALAATAGAGPVILIGPGADPSLWKARPATGVELHLSGEPTAHGSALRLDFDFHGGGGYAIAVRPVALDIPSNYSFMFHVRGLCRPNNLEFKLVDASGDNVWWSNQRNFEFDSVGRTVTLKPRHITFAWGPRGGGEPGRIASLEVVVTTGQGGRGSVWIEDLRFQPLPPPDTSRIVPVAGATSNVRAAGLALDADAASAWTSARRDRAPALTLDLGSEREFGGLAIDWVDGRAATDYDVELSSDGRAWQVARAVRGGNGGRDWIWLQEGAARRVRIRVLRAAASDGIVGIANVTIEPLAFAATFESFFMAIASASPVGDYPRAMLGQNIFWTVVGQDYDSAEGLLDEVGRLETGRAAYSIEPFVRDRGRLLTWNDVQADQALIDGDLPMPMVEWTAGDLRLKVSAFATGEPEHSSMIARYRLTNLSDAPRRDTLYLALRPFQVNPPPQFLAVQGGTAPIRDLAREGRVVRANGEHGIVSLSEPHGFGAATFDQGDVVEYLREGRLPAASRVVDPFAHASGALAYVLDLPARGSREVALVVPLHEPPASVAIGAGGGDPTPELDRLQEQTRRWWRERLDKVTVQVADTNVVRTLKSQLAYVLVLRNGASLQPGPRSYSRAWVRDGCLIATALLRLGETEAVRQFIEWYAPHQYADGKVPCAVGATGADPTPENDADGELIYLIAEYIRFTGDNAMAARLWPHVAGAIDHLEALRAQRLTPEWNTPENARFHGLMPPSISHEGYSARPMHSYWDDFFALRGYKDAAWLAGLLGRADLATYAQKRDAFARDLGASITASMAMRRIDFVPGCADTNDFDPTSTSIAMNPCDAGEAVLPHRLLEQTFERYWRFFTDRRDGKLAWTDYTPYEWRNVSAMVRLGWRERAEEVMKFLMEDRRPHGFQQWPEVITPDPRTARFLGDLPHIWVGTDYLRTALDLFAYERGDDSSLVVGSGVPVAWLDGNGVVVRNLRTQWGTLSFTMKSGSEGSVVVEIDQTDLRIPVGGLRVQPPLPAIEPASSRAWRFRTSASSGSVAGMVADVTSLPVRLVWEQAAADAPRETHKARLPSRSSRTSPPPR